MSFQFKKHNSDELDICVKSSNHLYMFEKKREIIEVSGRNGDLIIEDGSYKNKTLEIICVTEDKFNIQEKLNCIEEWLQSNGYEYIEFDDGNRISCYFLNITETKEIIKNVVEFKINFTCRREQA
ncbi:hypothetical protein [Clostridium chrysemydis]|uniref:hypothetical protein n=1 Tax=Clostridium chrysemydis TaxID=2665504 RepID=UPI001883FEA5|nr:hypothetical protein [Clostridium chrysemydis]